MPNFGDYGATYGSLSAVIVMRTWMWLSAHVFLLGAELNAELERQVDGGGQAAAAEQVVHAGVPEPVADSIEIDADRPSTVDKRAPPIAASASVLTCLATNGILATLGFALLRRGQPIGAAAVGLAAFMAWQGGESRQASD